MDRTIAPIDTTDFPDLEIIIGCYEKINTANNYVNDFSAGISGISVYFLENVCGL
jgi:hypothetical protein